MALLKLEDEKLKQCKDMLNSGYEENMIGFDPLPDGKQKAVISISNGIKRAVSFASTGNTTETAFKTARGKALKYCSEHIFMPKMAMISFVSEERRVSVSEFLNEVCGTKRYYYRYGVSFDEFYQYAFLEQEINALAIINWKTPEAGEKNKYTKKFGENGNQIPVINVKNITTALKERGAIRKSTDFSVNNSESVILFSTKSVFTDNSGCLRLTSGGLQNGLRFSLVEDLENKDFLVDFTEKTADYLISTVNTDGSMVYGYYPWYGRTVTGYNTIRHCLSVMSFLDMYTLTGSIKYAEAARKTYKYYFDAFMVEAEDGALAINDPANDSEIRLGALGLALVAMFMYSEAFNTDEDMEKAAKIAEMICRMQDKETGELTHVLSYPDFTLKDKFRIVYYSGEACYGLMKLYQKTKEAKYLEAVKKAFDFFIENNYEQYSDHWLSYSVNELTESYPEDKYFEFGLKNTFQDINFILTRETTFATMLELSNAAYKMIERIKTLRKDYLLEPYDIDKFYIAMKERIKFQAYGVMMPEMAMFFHEPNKFLYSAFIRHHSFRIRNDDVAHHIIGYCRYIENVLR